MNRWYTGGEPRRVVRAAGFEERSMRILRVAVLMVLVAAGWATSRPLTAPSQLSLRGAPAWADEGLGDGRQDRGDAGEERRETREDLREDLADAREELRKDGGDEPDERDRPEGDG